MSVLVVLLILLLPVKSFAVEQDKKIHCGASALATTLVYQSLDDRPLRDRRILAFIIPGIVGIIKEVTDDTGFSWEDVAANSVGSAAALLFTWEWRF